jgi:16S rRNA (guanine527-N7)-methyltransferase
MSAPAEAAAVFGDRFALAERYAGWLAGAGVERGLLGPQEAERVWSRHLLNSAAVAELMPPDAVAADVGSGAGLPGIPLWLARPDLTMSLIEPLMRRTSFLEEVVADLGLPLRVLRSRAEDVAEQFEVVVSRALAPLDRLVRWCAPLVAPGGVVLAIKGRTAGAELAAHGAVLRKARATSAEVRTVGQGEEPTTVIIMRFEEAAS